MKKRREYSTELCGKIQILSEGYTHEKIAGRLKIYVRLSYMLKEVKMSAKYELKTFMLFFNKINQN